MANVNVGVFFQAPTWSDPDFFALKVIQQMLGEYQANKYTGAHLNTGIYYIFHMIYPIHFVKPKDNIILSTDIWEAIQMSLFINAYIFLIKILHCLEAI